MEVFTSDRYIPPMTDTGDDDDDEVQPEPSIDPLEVQDDSEFQYTTNATASDNSEEQCHHSNDTREENTPHAEDNVLSQQQNRVQSQEKENSPQHEMPQSTIPPSISLENSEHDDNDMQNSMEKSLSENFQGSSIHPHSSVDNEQNRQNCDENIDLDHETIEQNNFSISEYNSCAKSSNSDKSVDTIMEVQNDINSKPAENSHLVCIETDEKSDIKEQQSNTDHQQNDENMLHQQSSFSTIDSKLPSEEENHSLDNNKNLQISAEVSNTQEINLPSSIEQNEDSKLQQESNTQETHYEIESTDESYQINDDVSSQMQHQESQRHHDMQIHQDTTNIHHDNDLNNYNQSNLHCSSHIESDTRTTSISTFNNHRESSDSVQQHNTMNPTIQSQDSMSLTSSQNDINIHSSPPSAVTPNHPLGHHMSVPLPPHPNTPGSMANSMAHSASSAPIPSSNGDYCDSGINSALQQLPNDVSVHQNHIQDVNECQPVPDISAPHSRSNSDYDYDRTSSNSDVPMVNMDSNGPMLIQSHQLQTSNMQMDQQLPNDSQSNLANAEGSLNGCEINIKRDVLAQVAPLNQIPQPQQQVSINNSMQSMPNNNINSLNHSYNPPMPVSSSGFPSTATSYDPVIIRRGRGRPRGSKNGCGMGRTRGGYGKGGAYRYGGLAEDRTCTAYDLRQATDPYGTARRGRPRSRFIVDLGEQNHEAWTKARLDLNVSDAELTTLLLSL